MKLFYSLISLMLTASAFAAESASIFVQNPAVFHQHQAELEKLKSSLENKNDGLDSLLNDANRMAKMNDQCAAISINDVMGDECWTFYRVELPAFEEKYMRVTGEVRLGHMETVRGLDDRRSQIDACVDALYSFAASKDQFLNLEGGVSLEPLSSGFQANYDFTLQYEQNHRKHAMEIAQKWGETCREMVVRKDGEGFAPFFVERLAKLNSDLANTGSLAIYKVDTTDTPTLYMDIAKPVRSAYYLNGVKLFHSRIAAGPVGESNLSIAFKNGVQVKANEYAIRNGKVQKFKGSVNYSSKDGMLNGRWIWENQGNTVGVDFGPEFDADSLAQIQNASAKEKSVAEAIAVESRRGVHPSLLVAATASMAPYANKAALRYGLKKNDLFIMPDIAAAARVKLGFGKNAESWVAVGAGGMLGFAFGDELEKVYVAPLAQLELGYKIFGFRETAIFPIAGSDEELWMQFRSGLFVTFGMFGVEVGHSLVTDVGNGGYLSVIFEL